VIEHGLGMPSIEWDQEPLREATNRNPKGRENETRASDINACKKADEGGSMGDSLHYLKTPTGTHNKDLGGGEGRARVRYKGKGKSLGNDKTELAKEKKDGTQRLREKRRGYQKKITKKEGGTRGIGKRRACQHSNSEGESLQNFTTRGWELTKRVTQKGKGE